MAGRSRGRSRLNNQSVTGTDVLQDQLGAILARLNALENSVSAVPSSSVASHVEVASNVDAASSLDIAAPSSISQTPSLQPESTASTVSDPNASPAAAPDATDRLIGALTALTKVRSNHYYISNFDPSLHDIDSWCEEVERARDINRWDDNECLSRIANCLKGDARCWLNEWVTNDRTWTNFKLEFKPLCSRRIDVANILFNVMSTNSDSYTTYAEYARRSLLRLNIVKGLSDELTVAIVIRGINDAQIRAAATNARLMPRDLVEFLSIYTKPNSNISHSSVRPSRSRQIEPNLRKRGHTFKTPNRDIKCYTCGATGHPQRLCPKRHKNAEVIPDKDNKKISMASSNTATIITCSFCKKPGHDDTVCFVKQRSESRNKNNVNFCRELEGSSSDSDVTTAIIQGIPMDVLVDSGSRVSLINESVLKHFRHSRLPTYQVLRGIGNQNIECTAYAPVVVEFSDIALEVDLLIVPSKCLSVPVLIGTDVLNREGVAYIRLNGKQQITRVSNTNGKDVLHVQSSAHLPINSSLTGCDRDKLHSIIDSFKEYLIEGTAHTTVTTGEMHIELTSDTPIHYRPYKLSIDEKSRVREIVSDLLDKGVIRESQSPYASPIILVKKRDGKDRMCVDYRALNAITVKDRFPLPLIDDHIDRLGKSKYFSSLDMATGFHQIALDSESIPRTGFVTPEGHYEYLKVPFGLANSPVVYQRIITKTLKPLIDAGKVLTYIDDVLILASTVDEALNNLRETLETLTAAGFSINLKKSTFVATEVEYLGRRISQGQVKPSERKIKALIDSPVPTNVRQVRQLLGLASYFRRYIPDYATKTACMARLTKRGVPFIWGEAQVEARKYLIECLTNEPVLAVFDPSLPTELHTDASSVGYGGVLLQVHSDTRRRAVAYFSKTTQGAEPKYHSYELETLAVVKALQHFRHYLIGVPFKIVTDCNALKLTERKKDLLPRVARWWMYMQDFNFTIEYRKGTMMQHADYLSRNPVDVCHITKPKNWAQLAQSADDETRDLIDKVKNNELDSSRYTVQNDLLYYKYSPTGEESRLLCYIPKGHRLSLLRIFHDQHQHIGTDKTIDLILRHFWFPGLRAFVIKYIAHCLICLSSKKVPRAPHQPISSWHKPDAPFSTIHVDVLGVLPASNDFKYVLLIIDAYSKYCLLYPMIKQDADELQSCFYNAISLFGTPKLIVCDKGRMFESSQFQGWVKEMGSNIHFITPQMHSENGQVERYCRTLLNMLRVEAAKNNQWSTSLWKLQLVINSTKQKTIQTSPLQLLIGIEGTTPLIRTLVRDVALDKTHPNREGLREIQRQRATELLNKNRCKQDDYVNKNRRPERIYKLGDMVFVIKTSQMTGKLDSGMRGPYRVTRVLPHGRYSLRLLGGSYGKTTQAAAEHMVVWRGEWTPESCAAFFDSEYKKMSSM